MKPNWNFQRGGGLRENIFSGGAGGGGGDWGGMFLGNI